MTKKLSLSALICLVFALSVNAQPGGSVEMADALREDGKIYVVVLIIVLLFLGITGYLIRLDRKISQLEKRKK